MTKSSLKKIISMLSMKLNKNENIVIVPNELKQIIDAKIYMLQRKKCEHEYRHVLSHLKPKDYDGDIFLEEPPITLECIKCGMIKTE